MQQYPVVDPDHGSTLVDIDASPVMDVRSGPINPGSVAPPSVVINAALAPVAIAVQPGADAIANAKGYERVGRVVALHIDHLRVVDWHIDIFR